MAKQELFEQHRPALLALAYRMLGEVGRAEDMVQDAWLRWQNSDTDVDAPKAFLLTTVARLCLDELGSARARRETVRLERLPEPVDLDESGIGRVEILDQVSMAFLVLLQRLTPAERTVLLLHDVFDMAHADIGAVLGRNDAACRQLLKRAREHVATERRVFETSQEEHRRLLEAFMAALTSGDEAALVDTLAEDAVLMLDPGPDSTRFGRLRDLRRPVEGAQKIATLIAAFLTQEPSARLRYVERTLNGEPAIVTLLDGQPISALLIAVAGGRVRRLFFQNDPRRLRHIGTTS